MGFPAGLRARLLRRTILHTVGSKTSPAIFHLSLLVKHFPADFQPESASPETEWHSPEACVKAAEQADPAIVWIGGTEPLFHPAIGEVVSALAASDRYVFLHTSGAGLRKRIHEFAPVDRLYLTLEVPTHAPTGASSMENTHETPSFRTVAEAIRTARLSGFHLCAHFTVDQATAPAGVFARMEALRPQHLDGIIASSAASPAARADARLSERLAQVSRLIPSRNWQSFSRLLELSYAELGSAVTRLQTSEPQSSGAGACQETV